MAYVDGVARVALALQSARALRGHDRDEVIRLAHLAVEAGAGAEARFLLAGELVVAGRHGEAAEVLSALPAGGGLDWARHRIGVHAGAGDPHEVLRLWREVPGLHLDPDPGTAYAVAFAHVVLHEYAAAEALARDVLPRVSEPLDRSRLLLVLGLALGAAFDVPAATAAFDEAVRLARTGPRAWLAAALHDRSILHEDAGRDDAMLADLQEALAIYGEVGDTQRYASSQTKLARHLIERGAFERAEDLLLAAHETLVRAAPTPFLVTCECVLVTLYDVWRPPYAGALALRHAAAALRLAGDLGVPSKRMQALAAAVTAEAGHGDGRRAAELADELHALVAPLGDPVALLDTLLPRARALAAVGLVAAAEDDLRRASVVAEGLPGPAAPVRVRAELARVRRDAAAAEACAGAFDDLGLHGLAHGLRIAVVGRSVPGPVVGAEAPASARLLVLGPLRWSGTTGGGEVVGEKRRSLLALLLEARMTGREGVAQQELLERLYPGDDDVRGVTALKQLVYQLRRTLGRSFVVRTGDGYALGAVATDAEAFLADGDTGWWRGTCPDDLPFDRARDTLVRRLLAAAQDRLHADPAEAARLGRILVESEPYDVEALEVVVRAGRSTGDARGAEAAYAAGRRRMADVGLDLPEAVADFLAARPGEP